MKTEIIFSKRLKLSQKITAHFRLGRDYLQASPKDGSKLACLLVLMKRKLLSIIQNLK